MNHGIAVVIGITSSWSFAAATVLCGLRDYFRRKHYDVIIYHDGLSEHDMSILTEIRDCQFETYHIEVPFPEKFKRVSCMAFSRYECFGLLEKYDQVIWLDADALIVDSLEDLPSESATGMAMFQHEGIPISVSFSSPVNGFDMDATCFNDGIFVLDRRVGNGLALKDWCYKSTNAYHEHINSDQAVINLMLQAHDIKVSKLNNRYNCHPVTLTPDAAILHPWGSGKFWNQFYDTRWDKYYQEWVRMGGEPCIEYETFKPRYLRENSLVRRSFTALGRLFRK